MSGTAKEAERNQELRRRAKEGDKAALDRLKDSEESPDRATATPHDPGNAPKQP